MKPIRVLLLLLAAVPMWAATADPCPTSPTFQTLQSYIDLGSTGCTIDGLLIFGFTYTPAGSAPGGNTLDNPTTTEIEIAFQLSAPSPTVIEDYTGMAIRSTENNNMFLVGQNVSMIFTIGFWVQYLDPTPLKGLYGVSLYSEFNETGTGNKAHVAEAVEDALGGNLGNLRITQGQNGPKSTLFDPLKLIYIQKTWEIQGGPAIDSTGSIGTVYQHFAQTPEPGTWVLLGTGMLGLGFLRRFKK